MYMLLQHECKTSLGNQMTIVSFDKKWEEFSEDINVVYMAIIPGKNST